jgi:hypothetical protein
MTDVPASVVEKETLEGGIFITPRPQADAVRERGFELVHEILSSSEVMIVADKIQRRLERVIPGIERIDS